MIKLTYFILLGIASLEDYKYHKVNRRWTLAVFLLGVLRLSFDKENRWVDMTLAFLCFFLLYLLYRCLPLLSGKSGRKLKLGGADVRLIPGMVLVQGWESALTGIFLGLFAVLVFGWIKRKTKKELPLVPWMSAGCFLAEIQKKVIYFL